MESKTWWRSLQVIVNMLTFWEASLFLLSSFFLFLSSMNYCSCPDTPFFKRKKEDIPKCGHTFTILKSLSDLSLLSKKHWLIVNDDNSKNQGRRDNIRGVTWPCERQWTACLIGWISHQVLELRILLDMWATNIVIIPIISMQNTVSWSHW